MKNKIINIFILLLAVFFVTADKRVSAKDYSNLAIGDEHTTSVNVGGSFSTKITVFEGVELCNFQFQVVYDTNNFILEQAIPLIPGLVYNDTINGEFNANYSTIDANQFIKPGTELFELKFKVNSNISIGDYELLKLDPEYEHVFSSMDVDHNIIPVDNLIERFKNITVTSFGDVNLDNKVNINDVTEIQKYLAGLVTLTAQQLVNADVNCDGVVDLLDANYIRFFIAKFIDNLDDIVIKEKYKVAFLDFYGETLDVQYIEKYQAAIAPTPPVVNGYTFVCWDISFDYITANLVVRPIYQVYDINKYFVFEVLQSEIDEVIRFNGDVVYLDTSQEVINGFYLADPFKDLIYVFGTPEMGISIGDRVTIEGKYSLNLGTPQIIEYTIINHQANAFEWKIIDFADYYEMYNVVNFPNDDIHYHSFLLQVYGMVVYDNNKYYLEDISKNKIEINLNSFNDDISRLQRLVGKSGYLTAILDGYNTSENIWMLIALDDMGFDSLAIVHVGEYLSGIYFEENQYFLETEDEINYYINLTLPANKYINIEYRKAGEDTVYYPSTGHVKVASELYQNIDIVLNFYSETNIDSDIAFDYHGEIQYLIYYQGFYKYIDEDNNVHTLYIDYDYLLVYDNGVPVAKHILYKDISCEAFYVVINDVFQELIFAPDFSDVNFMGKIYSRTDSIYEKNDVLKIHNIEEVKNGEEGFIYHIQGLIVAVNINSFLVEDETGILMCIYGDKSHNYHPGDKVDIIGILPFIEDDAIFYNNFIVEVVGTEELIRPNPIIVSGADLDFYANNNTGLNKYDYVEIVGEAYYIDLLLLKVYGSQTEFVYFFELDENMFDYSDYVDKDIKITAYLINGQHGILLMLVSIEVLEPVSSLLPPTNLSFEGNVFSWDPVENATAYILAINNRYIVVEGTDYEVLGYNNYDVRIKAIGSSKYEMGYWSENYLFNCVDEDVPVMSIVDLLEVGQNLREPGFNNNISLGYYKVRGTITWISSNYFQIIIEDENGNLITADCVNNAHLVDINVEYTIKGFLYYNDDEIFLTYVTIEGDNLLQKYQVVFYDFYDDTLSFQIVEEGMSAIEPEPLYVPGYEFIGWSVSFDAVYCNMYIYPIYELIDDSDMAVYDIINMNEGTLVQCYGTVYYVHHSANGDGLRGFYLADCNRSTIYVVGDFDIQVGDRVRVKGLIHFDVNKSEIIDAEILIHEIDAESVSFTDLDMLIDLNDLDNSEIHQYGSIFQAHGKIITLNNDYYLENYQGQKILLLEGSTFVSENGIYQEYFKHYLNQTGFINGFISHFDYSKNCWAMLTIPNSFTYYDAPLVLAHLAHMSFQEAWMDLDIKLLKSTDDNKFSYEDLLVYSNRKVYYQCIMPDGTVNNYPSNPSDAVTIIYSYHDLMRVNLNFYLDYNPDAMEEFNYHGSIEYLCDYYGFFKYVEKDESVITYLFTFNEYYRYINGVLDLIGNLYVEDGKYYIHTEDSEIELQYNNQYDTVLINDKLFNRCDYIYTLGNIVDKDFNEDIYSDAKEIYYIEATVIGINEVGFLIKDETGTVYVHLTNKHPYLVGDVVRIIGKTDYFVYPTLSYMSEITLLGTEEYEEEPTFMMPSDFEDYQNGNSNYSIYEYVEFIGQISVLEIEEIQFIVAQPYGTNFINIVIFCPSIEIPEEFFDKQVRIRGYLLGDNDGYILPFMITSIEEEFNSEMLDAPLNLLYDVESGTITWDEVEGSNGYIVAINNYTFITENCVFENIGYGHFIVRIKAITEYYEDISDWSVTLEFDRDIVNLKVSEILSVGQVLVDAGLYNNRLIGLFAVQGTVRNIDGQYIYLVDEITDEEMLAINLIDDNGNYYYDFDIPLNNGDVVIITGELTFYYGELMLVDIILVDINLR